MKSSYLILWPSFIACLLLLGASPQAGAQESNAPNPADFRAYSLIAERNIFNPNRYRRADNSQSPEEAQPLPDPVTIEFFNLLGTMSYDKGCYAYFSGSDYEFRKTVQAQDSIAGHKVVEISPSSVRLEREGKEVTVIVGMQMKRQNQGEWELVSKSERTLEDAISRGARLSSNDTNSSSPTAPKSSPSGDAANEDDDILKRLLQKREQELNNEKN